ncbi:SIR2 family protein [Sphingomonas pokkalii]|uniref:Fibronectin-binding protein (FBP) n=1 Tax=Sphingomonas pokkalii TaxID=2175090 RepID=A0A2U0SBT1_9SPHN|nr:SIR2 family protein [Sphingomonas pokkalii]PVX28826.1 fibronectin-binding protein (FBP) [Sphingomonas pokkalii]
MEWKAHGYRVGASNETFDDIPTDADELDQFVSLHRRRIEPWLSAVFQAEHLNLLLGSGFTTSVAFAAGVPATGMDVAAGTSPHAKAIMDHAAASAKKMGRGEANIEDQLRSAIAVLDGLDIIDKDAAKSVRSDINSAIETFLYSLLATERGIADADSAPASAMLQSFLLSFASRAASRERLHVFTTNYDRLIERGCDDAGLRIIDRFVGTLRPLFRNTRIELDYHYNPPGIRGEPRFMEGVVRLTKLHGSLDWRFDEATRRIYRAETPFGAAEDHPSLPDSPVDTVMIYPNPAKDVETTQYPYAELFRDFASATCRPNSVVVTYGYGFGDDHINRVLLDMLSVPSAHLVIIAFDLDDRIKGFLALTRPAQVSLLAGRHFGSLQRLVDDYLPKPALDYITGRMSELLKNRAFTEVPVIVAAPAADAPAEQGGAA